ncbi:lytic transglycosylase domain-containing protein [Sporosarcina trichiuri]|uniref:lytic transglycosylase domain-containing protein n=1 Tax=Sporosarcina trichiuri TaxID=3056445 RepID=UPI0025B44DC3|nr:lytic transglycosylase domain-containing protein [Sporosarcina sp. 0.2-SM1T-5]WJY28324.1 lytic transglycosylase domain-containing protein [Sporosarcina sp. 0.2-SM1T-5]
MKKKKRRLTAKAKLLLIALLVPVSAVLFTLTAIIWTTLRHPSVIQKSASTLIDLHDRHGGLTIPDEYIPIYKAAADEYDIPWTLLAAHHRVETRFSTMDPLLSPTGAEGHMQFMPCTFVGWSYPGCSGLGKGDIPEKDKTDPAIIAEYGGYGVDGSGDGKADPFNLEDAIFSAANYLSKSGAADGHIEKAIYHYNHSDKYVEDVLWFFDEYEAQQTKQAKK